MTGALPSHEVTSDVPLHAAARPSDLRARAGDRSRVSANSRALILQAPTGSGKSTQVPQILLDHGLLGDGEIVVLQPRRLATRMLAARVARSGTAGSATKWATRSASRTSSRTTRIRFVTEGVLLRQMLADPELRGVAAIVFDEFHERHLYGDITLARALDLQESTRPDLKLVVMSATLDAGALEKYLAPCELLTSGGRSFRWRSSISKAGPPGRLPGLGSGRG